MENIEIFVKQGKKILKVTLEEDAVKEIEDIRERLGTDSIIQAILYSIKLLAIGVRELKSGTTRMIDLPNGKKVDIELKLEEPK